jgi:hypothetical protein
LSKGEECRRKTSMKQQSFHNDRQQPREMRPTAINKCFGCEVCEKQTVTIDEDFPSSYMTDPFCHCLPHRLLRRGTALGTFILDLYCALALVIVLI